MSYTNKTTNLELPQYIATDKPSWLVDFNNAMESIDEYAGDNNDKIAEVENRLTNQQSSINTINQNMVQLDRAVESLQEELDDKVSDLQTQIDANTENIGSMDRQLVETKNTADTAYEVANDLSGVVNLHTEEISDVSMTAAGAHGLAEEAKSENEAQDEIISTLTDNTNGLLIVGKCIFLQDLLQYATLKRKTTTLDTVSLHYELNTGFQLFKLPDNVKHVYLQSSQPEFTTFGNDDNSFVTVAQTLVPVELVKDSNGVFTFFSGNEFIVKFNVTSGVKTSTTTELKDLVQPISNMHLDFAYRMEVVL